MKVLQFDLFINLKKQSGALFIIFINGLTRLDKGYVIHDLGQRPWRAICLTDMLEDHFRSITLRRLVYAKTYCFKCIAASLIPVA